MSDEPPDNNDLWTKVADTVKPIDRHDVMPPKDDKPGQKSPKTTKPVKAKNTPVPRQSESAEYVAPAAPSTEIDRRTKDKLRKGQMPIEGRLDLHGYNQEQAFIALKSFIYASYSSGKRTVIVITGKGMRGDGGTTLSKGVLKQKVPQWLADKQYSDVVLHVINARPQHGGDGALYVYLRRNRSL